VGVVKAGSFSPPPKVDSAILAISNITSGHFTNGEEEALFFDLIKHAFGSKRKMLAGNLAYLGKEKVARAFEASGVAPSARAEDISLPEWLTLLRALR
jgi:16S rRNA A1518/A1519 N6-dimethyltransferase RsmA/KsgA/DIM1 with predicted DNA glycosylase/AP lyase activity